MLQSLRSLAWMLLMTLTVLPAAHAEEALLFISNFTGGDAGGIQAAQLDLKSGTLKLGHRTGDVPNPFFLALSPNQKFLYSIRAKQFGSPETEEFAAFELQGTGGQLKALNTQTTKGSASCYIDVDKTGRVALVANYTTGNLVSVAIRPDGSLGDVGTFIQHAGSSVNSARQKAPYAHCSVVSPDNRLVLVADLGLDKVLLYRLDPQTARLTPNAVQPFVRLPPGAGPRHLTFHPNGKRVYVINELANSVTLFDYHAEPGLLVEQQTLSTLPEGYSEVTHCADLKITPNGKFLYGTNRGHDSIAAYRLADDGRMTLIEIEPSRGKGPQNLLITPAGDLLVCANMPGNNVAVFRIDQQTGSLSPVGEPVETTSPSCLMLRRP